MATKKTSKKAPAKAPAKTPAKPPEQPQERARPEDPPVGIPKLWANARPASELEGHHKLKVLLQGRSGSGKTTTAARFGRPLYVPTELQGIPTVKAVNPDALIFHNADGRPGLRDARDLQQFRAMIRDPDLNKRVDAVVLDSLTDCQRIIKDAYTKAQTSGRSTTDMDTWGSIIDLTARLAREVRDLEVNVLITVLDEEDKDDAGRLVHRPNLFGRRLPNDLMQYFNAVGFAHTREMDSGEIRFQTMFTAGGDKYLVKGLHGLDEVEPPEPLYWFSKVFGGDLDEEAAARVSAWKAMENLEEEIEEGAVPTSTSDKEEAPEEGDDPFASIQ